MKRAMGLPALQALHILMAAFGLALMACFFVVLSVPAHNGGAHTRFEKARQCIETAVPFRFNRTGLHELLAGAPRAEAACRTCHVPPL